MPLNFKSKKELIWHPRDGPQYKGELVSELVIKGQKVREARMSLDGAVVSPLRPLVKVVKKSENRMSRAVKKCELALATEHRQRFQLKS